MEPPAMLEDESAPENRRSTYLRVAFHALIFVLIIISTLVPIGFCLLYHQFIRGRHKEKAPFCYERESGAAVQEEQELHEQSPSCTGGLLGTRILEPLKAHHFYSSWVLITSSPSKPQGTLIWEWKLHHCKGIVQGQGEYLIIQESGRYFIYAQLSRKEPHKAPFSVMLYENKTSTPLNSAVGALNGTVHFARPFLLKKGDKLYCKKNKEDYHNLLEPQTYWGLFKM
ncbi:uncharacterized protein LOC131087015 [Melospiza georgiana]|uniref:uncharacterized protein LOC131087015 n=1 Tax=Melospiza georgiana TaxID=44398 RepID=UPI0025AB752D|nr:uncharacterized protein LOC131087015 [Melospiza georgiana]